MIFSFHSDCIPCTMTALVHCYFIPCTVVTFLVLKQLSLHCDSFPCTVTAFLVLWLHSLHCDSFPLTVTAFLKMWNFPCTMIYSLPCGSIPCNFLQLSLDYSDVSDSVTNQYSMLFVMRRKFNLKINNRKCLFKLACERTLGFSQFHGEVILFPFQWGVTRP